MDQLLKLNTMHKIIMNHITGDAVLTAGVVHSGWKKGDHFRHSSERLLNEIAIFQRQLPVVMANIENENREFLERSLEMYINDRKKLAFDVENDKLDKELFEPVMQYINSLNETIDMLREVINVL